MRKSQNLEGEDDATQRVNWALGRKRIGVVLHYCLIIGRSPARPFLGHPNASLLRLPTTISPHMNSFRKVLPRTLFMEDHS